MKQKYYNYRRNEKEMNEEIIFCSADPEASNHYGNIQRVFSATERTDADHAEAIEHAMKFYGIDSEAAEKAINPEYIVSSAGAWDDIEFINYLYSETRYFAKYDGIITSDGAIFFEINAENLIETNYI